MQIYNLIEYTSDYSETTKNLWFYSNNEATDLMQILLMIIVFSLPNIRLNY